MGSLFREKLALKKLGEQFTKCKISKSKGMEVDGNVVCSQNSICGAFCLVFGLLKQYSGSLGPTSGDSSNRAAWVDYVMLEIKLGLTTCKAFTFIPLLLMAPTVCTSYDYKY